MAKPVTISFTRPGICDDVWITTNMTTPPWSLQKMHVSDQKTAEGDRIFYLEFPDVLPGLYQYKVRIGLWNWVVDKTKMTTKDDAGNLNNAYFVEGRRQSQLEHKEPEQDSDPDVESSNDASLGFDQDDTSIQSRLEESPLLPHEMHSSAGERASPEPIQLQSSPQQAAVSPSSPTRMFPAGLECINESDELKESSSDEARIGDATVEDRTETDIGVPRLLPHEIELDAPGAGSDDTGSDADTETADVATVDPHESLYAFDSQNEPTLPHEDIVPPSRLAEQAPLLAHEDGSSILGGTDSTFDVHNLSAAHEEPFAYEKQLRSADGSLTDTNLDPHSGQRVVDNCFTSDLFLRGTTKLSDDEPFRVLEHLATMNVAPDAVPYQGSDSSVTVLGRISVGEGKPLEDSNISDVDGSHEHGLSLDLQKTTGAKDWSCLGRGISATRSLDGYTLLKTPQKKGPYAEGKENAVESTVSHRQVRQQSSDSMHGVTFVPPKGSERVAERTSLWKGAGPSTTTSGVEAARTENPFWAILRAVYECICGLVRRVFLQGPSSTILGVAVALAVYVCLTH